MHELSIAMKVVALATQHASGGLAQHASGGLAQHASGGLAQHASGGLTRHGDCRVATVTLRIGQLSCVHEDALRSAFDIAREGTPLAAADLRIVAVPVRVWCPHCLAERELPDIQRFACPDCGRPTGDIRAGRELDLESLELVETADT
jgi:hydrogenase nickel incorporation protein HypA/HybF